MPPPRTASLPGARCSGVLGGGRRREGVPVIRICGRTPATESPKPAASAAASLLRPSPGEHPR
ncbi:Os01g0202600 [Oryza sativa Japonica Group]|uniref:Os01g0202600 protein n=1 Tax=Oryza sativa subsp. japonica TaxID=39947 RepID=C7IXX6_ORYSJ|nr:hypothetical protein DAI22_01g072900 [Oryza sativa Japonica Group]BAH90953.1 Os01g0202600 [Oryza sativa Japonica Group]|eukprot:NP_001172223.1 Os01g0202600 [Oryza sativa Japonica Group]